MIKYFINKEKRQVIGLLEGTQWDAIKKIDKMIRDTDFCFSPSEKYIMPSEFRAVVTCDPADEFDVEVGKRIAKQRILDRYYPALDKRVKKVLRAVEVLNGKISENFEKVENNS